MSTSPRIHDDFDSPDLPADWRAARGGSLQLSSRHRKDGQQSLQWSWTHGAALIRDGLALSPMQYPQAGMQGWVYCEQPIDGRLTFRLGSQAQLAAGTPAYQFRFSLNFTGWRMFRVSFERDCRAHQESGVGSRESEPIECLEIVPPRESPEGCLWLDALVIGAGVSGQRSADSQIPEHADGLGGWCEHWPLHYSRQSPVEPLPARVTDEEQRDFATILGRYRTWLLGDIPDLTKPLLRRGAEQTAAYIRRGWTELEALGIMRNEQGRITGPGLVKDFGSPTSFKHLFYDILMPLVFDWKVTGNEAARGTVLVLFDYLHDQGWAEGSGLGDLWLNPLGFAPYCHAIAMMREELRSTGRLDTAVRAAQWYLNFGKTFSRFDQEYIETNADALRSIVFTSLVMILAMDDTPQKVQYMNGWLAWYNDALAISPRFTGLIKPDGLGFHHQGVYAGAYATEAYEFCALLAWLLHGTVFAAAPESVANLKQALLTQDTISNKYDVPYATMGRMPHPGVRIFSAYAYLALAGDPMDADLAGIFMRLWDPRCVYLEAGDKGTNYLPQVLSVDLDAQGGKFLFYQTPGRLQILQELVEQNLPAAPSPQGFWSKPWGALAIHRRDDWLVSVKGWSQYVWDFEMHPKCWAMVEENVFARYWSYGTLQPLTHGQPINPVASGWNLDRGWDWCRWPGATTPHLSLEELYDPKTTWASRFFSSATFVGGVSSEGSNGLFVLKLHEHYYDPTFRALKSYFFVDDAVICLGSNIETRDAAHTMETTLFQSWMPEETMPMQVNGETVTAFPFDYAGTAGQSLTLMDPYGNGYYLPDGGQVCVRRGMQHSRDAWNRGETSGAFSTCWLDHGQPPRDDGYGEVRYHYVQLIRTTPARLADVAAHPPYGVLQQNHQAHIIAHRDEQLMAYALFETDWLIPHGLVRKTDTPVMVLTKESVDGLILSLADPDLRLPKRRNMGYLDEEANATPSRPSTVRVEVRGAWRLRRPEATVRVLALRDEVTVLEFTCQHGLTVEVGLEK
jgi:chondroitin-sulfate-ABC endolyase/exolyase